MAKSISHHSKYLHLVYTKNFSGPSFHTTRNPILPHIARGDNLSEPDYLYCLRPAKLPVVDLSKLAGDPRTSAPTDQAIKPEIFEKWNQRSKPDIHKEWSKLAVFY